MDDNQMRNLFQRAGEISTADSHDSFEALERARRASGRRSRLSIAARVGVILGLLVIARLAFPGQSLEPPMNAAQGFEECMPPRALDVPAQLSIKLAVDKTQLARGQNAAMSLSLANTGNSQYVNERGALESDFVVASTEGVVWMSSFVGSPSGIEVPLNIETFYPGFRKQTQGRWGGQGCGGKELAPGRYTVWGLWWTHVPGTSERAAWWSEPRIIELAG